jgi:hypothetical protein
VCAVGSDWSCHIVTRKYIAERKGIKIDQNDNKNEIKIANNEAHLTVIYLCIPVIPWVWVAVCHSVPKSSTIPVPTVPVLEAPRVYPYPCETLKVGDNWPCQPDCCCLIRCHRMGSQLNR